MNVDLSFLSAFTLIRMISRANNVLDIWELDDMLTERHPFIWPKISGWFL